MKPAILLSKLRVAENLKILEILKEIPRKLEVQETTPQTEGASAQSSQTGASSSGNSENLRKRQSRAPVSVENNAKKMMLAVKHFEASLDTRGLDKKIQDLERTEANMRRDFEEKMEKIKKS